MAKGWVTNHTEVGPKQESCCAQRGIAHGASGHRVSSSGSVVRGHSEDPPSGRAHDE